MLYVILLFPPNKLRTTRLLLTKYHSMQIPSHRSFKTLWLMPGSKLTCAGVSRRT